jgi:putative hydrolase of the HAD superfamily
MQPSDVGALFRPLNAESTADHALAMRYAPIIRFDDREPFLPLAAGYTVFRQDGPSPSFPMAVRLTKPGSPDATFAIEYAIWWDWDIQHLYELEHIWVYIDGHGSVIRGEASAHGGYRDMGAGAPLPLTGDRLTLCSEPGKHAFAADPAVFINDAADCFKNCGPEAGDGGVCATPLFEGKVPHGSPADNVRIHAYLQRLAFEPTMQFTQVFGALPDRLTPWPRLEAWIPGRVTAWLAELERQTISPC